MKIICTEIPDILIIEPEVFQDDRGFFFESYNYKKFAEATSHLFNFVQDNHSYSKQNVLRGLHYQIRQPQGKLVRVVSGSIFDVAVDIRKSSSTFGRWIGYEINAENKRQLWIPPGFAHGFVVLSEFAEVLYKTTDYYAPQYERCILWNDPDLGIDWRLTTSPILSIKDKAGKLFPESEVFTQCPILAMK
ncbi:dTDP-4-dehydrorhamnose 3,5-epimerase [Pelatocladus sp. BLCC-F211]|uniref:dTDP-4-dehydrorhamnose 3,5-epimerase n=1 Tax=Pelatocladus sp. BLCC-F211 TaxID=3342752 RepID=UPI0035B85B8B